MAWVVAYQSASGTGTVALIQSGVNVDQITGTVSSIRVSPADSTAGTGPDGNEWLVADVNYEKAKWTTWLVSPTSSIIIRDMLRPG